MAGYLVWMIGPVERLLVGRVSPNAITAGSLVMCGITALTYTLPGWRARRSAASSQ